MYLPDDPARAEVLSEMVQPLAWASRHKELQALCRRALEGEGRPEDEMMFWMGLGLSLMGQGRFSQARSAFEQMTASSALGEPERVTGEAHAALCGVYLGDLAAAERVGPATSGRWGPMAAGMARLAAATAELNAGRPEHALAMFEALAATGRPDRWSLQLTAWRRSARPRRGGKSPGRVAGVGPSFSPEQYSRAHRHLSLRARRC